MPIHKDIKMRAQPIDARFALCPWALYHIEVLAA